MTINPPFNICVVFQGQPRFLNETIDYHLKTMEMIRDHDHVNKLYIQGHFWDHIGTSHRSDLVVEEEINKDTCIIGGARYLTDDEINSVRKTFYSFDTVCDELQLHFYNQIHTLYPFVKQVYDNIDIKNKWEYMFRELFKFICTLGDYGQIFLKYYQANKCVPQDTDIIIVIRTDTINSKFDQSSCNDTHTLSLVNMHINWAIESFSHTENAKTWYYNYKNKLANFVVHDLQVGSSGPFASDRSVIGFKHAFDTYGENFIDNSLEFFYNYFLIHKEKLEQFQEIGAHGHKISGEELQLMICNSGLTRSLDDDFSPAFKELNGEKSGSHSLKFCFDAYQVRGVNEQGYPVTDLSMIKNYLK
jgi:hypothetical protein